MRHRIFIVSLITILLLTGSTLIGQDDKTEWGNLTATFLYDGDPPKPAEIKVDKDQDFVKGPLFDPSLLIDNKTKGIANVVIWLDHPADAKPLQLHPSYDDIAKQEVVIDGINAQIVPHVTGLWTRQTLILRNSDPIGHNLRFELPNNPEFSSVIPSGDQRKNYKRPEKRPMPGCCGIHPWMSAYLLVKDHPLFAISNREGKLTIRNLPVGKHKFAVWHEQPGYVIDVNQDGKPEKWKNGRVTIDIKPGDNDLGKIEFKPVREKR